MKKVVSLLVVLLAVFTLVSCTTEEKTLQMLWWSDGTEGEVMQELLDEYLDVSGVTIELVTIPYNDYEARLATMISGGEAPALARVTEGHLNNFKAQIESLEGVYDKAGFTNLFYNTDGDVISLPMDITANGLFVNLDLVEEYGINLPTLDDVWTWDEFEVEFSKINDQEDGIYPGIFDHQGHRFMPLFYQSGITLWEELYTDSNLTSQQAVETLQRLMDWYEEGFLPQLTYTVNNSAAEFRKGTYGFHMSGNWNVSGYQNITEFEWTVVPMPSGANRATILGGKSLAAFSGSGEERAAKDFIEWIAEGENHDRFTGGVPYLTPRLGAEVDYGPFAAEYEVFLAEIAATNQAYVQDWLNQVMIPGMYPLINDLVKFAADPNNTKTALQLLQELEAALKAAAPTA
jgi:alpha-1,4-digalacturonate transport system substrate-binding protein